MVTTAYGNVINLQPGGPGVSAAAHRVLMECRDLAARRSREALREMLQKVSDDVCKRAENSTEAEARRFLLRIDDAIREKGGRLEGQLAAHWAREFDTALKGVKAKVPGELLIEDMQIVEYGEMDEDLALKALARRVQDKCEDELYALGRRFDHLLGREKRTDEYNPAASPEVFTRALQGAFQDLEFDTPTRLELWRCLEGYAVEHIGQIYHAINAQLLKHNVLPNVRRGYARSPNQDGRKDAGKGSTNGDIFAMLQRLVSGGAESGGNAASSAGGLPGGAGSGVAGITGVLAGGVSVPPAHVWSSLEALQHAVPASLVGQPMTAIGGNVLHDFRASQVGQELGQLDAITVDIVAMLFDMIFDDREISDPIKALVGKLQIPVLKVAMLDRSFFSSKAHPARRLLDLISRAALRWGRQVGHDDPIYRKIAEVIDQIHSNFQQDTALFGALSDDLESFLSQHEAAADGNVSRAAMLVVQRELEELAAMAVNYELQLWLASSLPRVLADLLDHEWRKVLQRTYLDDGPESEAWKNALATACDLVSSARPKTGGQDRQTLVRQLPLLLKQLSAGFDRIGVEASRRHALLDGLFSLHASAMRGAELPPEPALEPSAEPELEEPEVASQSLGDGEVTVESISLKSPMLATVASQDVEALQRGDWVEFIQEDAPVRYRLSWISPQRGIFLFTNPQSPHALAVSPEAMSLQIQRGEVRIVSTEPIFDRALSRTIETLQAA